MPHSSVPSSGPPVYGSSPGRALVAAVLLAFAPLDAFADLEIWLARTPACNSCELFREAATARGYGDSLRYEDTGGTLTIPIRNVAKSELAPAVRAQIDRTLLSGPAWDLNLTVIVVDGDDVLIAGNIAESADNRQLVQPRAVMFPPDRPDADDPALADGDLYAPFFRSHWNLEYFVDVALGHRERRQPGSLVDLAAADPIRFGPANVVLWASAGTPRANSLFIPTRLREIRARLESLGIPGIRYLTLYGHGPTVPGNDTSFMDAGRIAFRRAGIDADLAADGPGLNRVFTGLADSEGAHTLLVQVGHSGPVGSPLWGSGLTLLPDDIAELGEQQASELIMVSGACNGGMFATVPQCGFFAAHPDVVASGCQLSSEALASSDDYLRFFFRAATGAAASAAAGRPASAEARDRANGAIGDGDPADPAGRAPAPLPTLEAAHWYATTRIEDHQISYTTTDAIIDAYFAAHPDALPAAMTVEAMRRARASLGDDAALALDVLTADLPASLVIPLTGYVELNHAAQARLADATELSSQERNRITAMPYKLALPLLGRRIAYAVLAVGDERFDAAAACGSRSLDSFLNTDLR